MLMAHGAPALDDDQSQDESNFINRFALFEPTWESTDKQNNILKLCKQDTEASRIKEKSEQFSKPSRSLHAKKLQSHHHNNKEIHRTKHTLSKPKNKV